MKNQRYSNFFKTFFKTFCEAFVADSLYYVYINSIPNIYIFGEIDNFVKVIFLEGFQF